MIIASNRPLKVGEIIKGDSNKFLSDYYAIDHQEFRFMVLREATRDEYIKCLLDENPDGAVVCNCGCQNWNYYEISLD